MWFRIPGSPAFHHVSLKGWFEPGDKTTRYCDDVKHAMLRFSDSDWCLFLFAVLSADPEPEEQILTEKDLNVLMNLMHNYSDKWQDIGLALGFALSELNVIGNTPSLFATAPVSYLRQLLYQWMQWPTNDHSIKPTLEALCTALRSSSVGLGCLSVTVEEEIKKSKTSKKWFIIQPNSKCLCCQEV